MRSGIYETVERPSVRPSVGLSHHSTAAAACDAAGLLPSAVRAEDIDRQRRPQHGAQQQMRAVSR